MGEDMIANTSPIEKSDNTGITVEVNSYSIPDEGAATADMEDNNGSYLIHIEDNEDAKACISDVYKQIYGNKLPHNLCAYEISMTDLNSGIPITGLGRRSVEVTIPMPAVESSIVSMDGMDALKFTAKHFSFYGVYNFSSGSNMVVADVKEGQAVFASLGKKDDSPDTGDHSIHPKWFFGAGLFFASMAMFFYRGGRKKERTS